MYISLFLLLTNFGCSREIKPTIVFKISNESSCIIKNLRITNGFDNVEIAQLNPKSNKTISFVITKSSEKYGGYMIKYACNRITKIRNFGYYKEGVTNTFRYNLFIKNDTIIINQK